MDNPPLSPKSVENSSEIYDLGELGQAIDSLTPEELAKHQNLALVYEVARAIAVASYNGMFNTPEIDDFPEELVPLVERLLSRYTDDRGWVTFPVVGEFTTEKLTTASHVFDYELTRRTNPNTGQESVYFSSFHRSYEKAKQRQQR